MSTTTLATSDILPSSVPKLLPTGLNWTVFSIRFQETIEAKGFWGHFDGTSPEPTVSSPPAAGEQEVLDQWMKNERSTKALLTHRVPIVIYLCDTGVSTHDSVLEMSLLP